MTTSDIKLHTTLACSPDTAYNAWLDSKIHGEMVEGDAKIDPTVGGHFSIWGDAIVGKTLELDPIEHRIIQEWRYEFDKWPKTYMSHLEVIFRPNKNGQTTLELNQTDIPEEFADEVAKGWKDYYFTPMQKYFNKGV